MDSGDSSAFIGQCYVVDTAYFGSILFLVEDTDVILELECGENPNDDNTLVKAYGKTIGKLPDDISCWTTAFIRQGFQDALDIQIISVTPYEMPDKQLLVRIGVKKKQQPAPAVVGAPSLDCDEDIPF